MKRYDYVITDYDRERWDDGVGYEPEFLLILDFRLASDGALQALVKSEGGKVSLVDVCDLEVYEAYEPDPDRLAYLAEIHGVEL